MDSLALIEARLRGAAADLDYLLDRADTRGCAFILTGMTAYLLAELHPQDPAEAVAAMRAAFLGWEPPPA